MITSPLIENIQCFYNTEMACTVINIYDRDFITPFDTEILPPSFYGMIICNRGTLNVARGKQTYEMSSMMALPIASWQSCKLYNTTDFKGKIILFNSRYKNTMIRTDYFCELMLQLANNPIIKLSREEYGSIVHIKKSIELLNSNEGCSESYNFVTQHAISAILYILYNAVCEGKKSQPTRVQSRQGELFREFLQLLLSNYKQQRSVIFYAQEMCVTPRYLSRVIKEVSGRSAAEWIDDLVTTEIVYQMRFSMRTIQQIAYDMGFPNQSFFGKYFKAQVGCSPTSYRLSMR